MKHKVLIVDDSKLARMGVRKILNTLHPDWDCVDAVNADEALARAQESTPDLVLLDYNMPGRDGVTLASELKQLDQRIAVAVVSANQQVEVIERAHKAGATFLPKPLTEAAVANFIDGALQQRDAAGAQ